MEKARDIMTTDLKTIDANASVAEAARNMRDYDVGSLPVLENGRFVGVITDRDVCCRVVADGRDVNQIEVRSAMTSSPICCTADANLDEVSRIMRDNQVRRCPVVDENDRLVGYIALRDLALDREAKESGKSQEVLEGVSS